MSVLLADDHEAVLRAATALLESSFDIVGTAADGHALVEAALRLQPDVVVVDISMPLLNGIEAIKRLKEAGSTAKIVFLTVHDDPDFVHAALSFGNVGYVVKPRMATDLIPAIHHALAGRSFVSHSVPGQP
jgi:DNA-binding NarL/FixJ family response regulator